MNKSDMSKFSAIIYGLAEENGGTVSESGVILKFDALKSFSIEQVTDAANWLMRHRKETFPPVPKVTEFQDAIDMLSGRAGGKTRAEIEADKVYRMSKIYGRECKAIAKDPVTNYLIRNRWNWWHLGTMKDDDWKWWRRDFVAAYQEMSAAPPELLEANGLIKCKEVNALARGISKQIGIDKND